MGLDSAVVSAICSELSARFNGAKVRGLEQLDQWDIVIKTNRGDLAVSCHPRLRRLAAVRSMAGSVSTHFARTSDGVLKETVIAAINQKGLERIVEIVFEKKDVLDETARYKVLAELMGGSGNIMLLTSDDRVIVSLRKTTRNSAGSDYRPPKQPSWIEPLESNKERLASAILEDPDALLSNRIQRCVMGLGPLLSREVTYRCGLDASKKVGECSPEELAHVVQKVTEIHQEIVLKKFSPMLYYKGEQPTEISCFPLSHLHELKKKMFASMNDAVVEFYLGSAEVSRLEEKRRSLLEVIRKRIKSKKELLANQLKDLREAERSDDYKTMGDAILMNLNRIRKGASEVILEHPLKPEKKLKVSLLPGRTPQETAQEYYKKYKKMKKAVSSIKARVDVSTRSIAHLEGLNDRVENAASVAQLARMTGTLAKQGIVEATAARAEREKKKYKTFVTRGGWEVVVGRSDEENEEITFRLAKPKDIFFHVGSAPGSHTIMKVQATGRIPGKKDIEEVASVAAYFSKARTSRLVPVVYTERRYVRKPRKAPAGRVTVERGKTVMVEPRKPETA